MHEQQEQEQRHQQAQSHHRPGHAALVRMHLQQEQAGDAEDEAGDREHVDEPSPGRTGIATLVQVVEVRDPATVGGFRFDRAVAEVDGDPAIAAGTRQRRCASRWDF